MYGFYVWGNRVPRVLELWLGELEFMLMRMTWNDSAQGKVEVWTLGLTDSGAV